MKIGSLKIAKLRCFSDFELSFEDTDAKSEIIFLAGENGSGKSTILWALAAAVSYVLYQSLPNTKQFSKTGDFSVEIKLSEREKKIVSHPIAGSFFKWDEQTRNPAKWILDRVVGPQLTEYRKKKENEDRTEIGALEYLPADRFISAEQADTLRTVSTGEVETRSLGADLNLTQTRKTGQRSQSKYRDVLRQFGTLLQTDIRNQTHVFEHIKRSRATGDELLGEELEELVFEIEKKSHYERIKRAISKYLPGITLSTFNDQSENPPAMVLQSLTNERIELAQLSSGEFQIVVWLIDLIQKDLRNSIILWDEPEQHLHPSLSMKIPDMLREFCPGSQIWIATQSPFIISSAKSQDIVYYLERDEKGTVQIVEEADSKIQSFRRLTPNGFLATWGKQVVFVEGIQDIAFFQSLLDSLGIDAIAAQLTSKPSLEKLDSILREMKDRWGVPLAVAVVDRDYHSPEDFNPYPLITYYSENSCDLEGLLLEPEYMNDPTLVAMAEDELSTMKVAVSGDPIKQLIETLLNKPQLKNKLYGEYFEYSISRKLGKVIREREFDINDLEGDASKRITEVVNTFIPSLSIDDVSFEYPEVLKWCKGKRLLPEIGSLIGVKRKRKFFLVLSECVARNPPDHLVSFLKKCSDDFNS